MNRRQFMSATGTGAAAVLAGCLGESAPGTASADDGVESEGNAIRVGATGEAEADPDRAVASVGVEASGEDADEVRTKLADGAASVKDALLELGIPDDQITTARFDIYERRRETRYEGVHAYTVEIDDIDEVGVVIDTAVAAGADDVGRVRFTLSEETRAELRAVAIEDALANADREAELIAENRGMTVVGTRDVATGDVGFSPVSRQGGALMAEASDSGGTDLDSGPVTVTARVEVTYDARPE